MRLGTIIVALDCSDISESTIEALDRLLLQPETRVIFSHVLPPETEAVGDRSQRMRESSYQAAEKQLQEYQARLSGSEIEIVSGDPAEEIIRLAHIHHADLIVIGSRGLKGVERIIEDSVSSQVVTDAPCSVFVVKGS